VSVYSIELYVFNIAKEKICFLDISPSHFEEP